MHDFFPAVVGPGSDGSWCSNALILILSDDGDGRRAGLRGERVLTIAAPLAAAAEHPRRNAAPESEKMPTLWQAGSAVAALIFVGLRQISVTCQRSSLH